MESYWSEKLKQIGNNCSLGLVCTQNMNVVFDQYCLFRNDFLSKTRQQKENQNTVATRYNGQKTRKSNSQQLRYNTHKLKEVNPVCLQTRVTVWGNKEL